MSDADIIQHDSDELQSIQNVVVTKDAGGTEFVIVPPNKEIKILELTVKPDVSLAPPAINFITRRQENGQIVEVRTFDKDRYVLLQDDEGTPISATITRLAGTTIEKGESFSIICADPNSMFDIGLSYVEPNDSANQNIPTNYGVFKATIDRGTNFPLNVLMDIEPSTGVRIYSFIITNTATDTPNFRSFEDVQDGVPHEKDADPFFVSVFEQDTDGAKTFYVNKKAIGRGDVFDLAKEFKNTILITEESAQLFLDISTDDYLKTPRGTIKCQFSSM